MVGLPRLWPLGADPPLLESPKITYTPKVTPTNPKQQPFVYRLEEREGGLYKTTSYYMVGGGAATRSCGTCMGCYRHQSPAGRSGTGGAQPLRCPLYLGFGGFARPVLPLMK